MYQIGIDTVVFELPEETNQHLYNHPKAFDMNSFSVHNPNNLYSGVVAMTILEYRSTVGDYSTDYYKWKIEAPNGYTARLNARNGSIKMELSIPKWFFGTSYILVNIDMLKNFINELELQDWRISRLDICTNFHFQSDNESIEYMRLLKVARKLDITNNYKTGFVKNSKSSYCVSYLKHKDKFEKYHIKDEFIFRCEYKLNMRNTYDNRKAYSISNVDKHTLYLWYNTNLYKAIKWFDFNVLSKLDINESTDFKRLTRSQKNRYYCIKEHGSIAEALFKGAISEATYYNYKRLKSDTICTVPSMDKSTSLRLKMKLQEKKISSYLKYNLFSCTL